MGLPSINIIFKTKAQNVIKRGERGIVALILKDTLSSENPLSITSVSEIPSSLTLENRNQIELALRGGVKSPRKVIAYVVPNDATSYDSALNYLETTKFDYLVIPEIAEAEVTTISSWIKDCRDKKDIKVKAVLPHADNADSEGVINFATDDIKVKDKVYTAAQYCSRIAGILAGTPLNMSATYQVLPEVEDVSHLTKAEFDKAIDSGKLVLMNDGEKVKIARAVNSLVTTTQEKGEDFKKTLIVDKCDMWHDDVKRTVADYYLGKYVNNYDSKIILITAIQAYNDQLVLEGLLDGSSIDYNRVFIDLDVQKQYLKEIGEDVDSMNEQQLKEANTKDKVFLGSNLKWNDAMEDFSINVSI
ncbi:phage tail sheath protein [Gottschalkia purinilytica]|uniref:Phage tail sheath protein n=1 Tax=Gottschalkia purinilytica TaxID=1503 RepID=A0A0L0WF10_GOTPU|nr:phage tail sheath subtilisin-like domain-containing protein [Gottschalkia purinilytica]KNF10059.1 phage tail sheath protein [Gottschalkia purinilytica]